MKRSLPLLGLLAAALFFSTTGFQCGSAELTSAKLYMQQKQWDKAEQSLMKELAKNEKNEEAWFLLGQTRLEVKNYAGMNEAYTRALQVGDVHKKEIQQNRLAVWASLYNDGVALYNKGREDPTQYDKALTNFDTAIQLVPDSASTYYVASLVHFAKGDMDGAIKKLNTGLEKNPSFVEAARLKGQIHYSRGTELAAKNDAAGSKREFTEAAGAFEMAYKAAPGDAANITSLIDVYDRLGQSDKAMQMTEAAIARDPNNKVYRYASGVFLLKQDKYQESIEQFAKAVEIDPSYIDAEYNLGVANLNWGVAMKAESDKKMEEAAAKGLKNVKEDKTYLTKFEAALPHLEKAAVARPDDAALHQQLGRLYMNLNMKEKAKAAFEQYDRIIKAQ